MSNLVSRRLNQYIHVALLIFLSIVTVLAFRYPTSLLELFHAAKPISNVFSYLPYTEWISAKSNWQEVTNAFISLVYLGVAGLFINLLITIFPPFQGKPAEVAEPTMLGFGELLEKAIYSKLAPSISFNSIGNAMALRSAQEIRLRLNHEGIGWKELIDRHLAIPAIRNSYLLIWLMGFLGFPIMAYTDVNHVGASILPFNFIVLLMVYAQARCLFEIVLLLILRFEKHAVNGSQK